MWPIYVYLLFKKTASIFFTANNHNDNWNTTHIIWFLFLFWNIYLLHFSLSYIAVKIVLFCWLLFFCYSVRSNIMWIINNNFVVFVVLCVCVHLVLRRSTSRWNRTFKNTYTLTGPNLTSIAVFLDTRVTFNLVIVLEQTIKNHLMLCFANCSNTSIEYYRVHGTSRGSHVMCSACFFMVNKLLCFFLWATLTYN